MGTNDWLLIDTFNPTFIALTVMAILHSLSAWYTGDFRVPAVYAAGGGAKCKCDRRYITHAVKNLSKAYFVVWMRILMLPYQTFKRKRPTMSAACFAARFPQMVRAQQCHNITTTCTVLMRTFLITSLRIWQRVPTIPFNVSAALLLQLKIGWDY